MDPEAYYGLVRYLSDGKVPPNLSEEKQKVVERVAHAFQIDKEGQLWRISNECERKRLTISGSRKNEIMKENHDDRLAGHFGKANTYDRISQDYYWPKMKEDIDRYVTTCGICQKRAPRSGEAPLEAIRKTIHPFRHVGIDVMGLLPRTMSENRYIVIAVDHFTKWTEARALKSNDAQSIASFFYDDVICRHGIPTILTSDRGVEFVNDLLRAMTQTYKIKHIKTTAYHPEGNGQVERMNRTIKNIISKLSDDENWDHYLSGALFALRTTRSQTTKFTPSELLYGFRMPRNPQGMEDEMDPEEYLLNEIQVLKNIREDAGQFIKRAQDRQKSAHDKAKKEIEPLKIGDPFCYIEARSRRHGAGN